MALCSGNLDRGARATAWLARRSRAVTVVLVAVLVVLSWLFLVAMGLRAASAGLFGPGGSILEGLPELQLPSALERLLALCLTPAPAALAGPFEMLALVAMWFVMAVAMMLPSAAPMIATYCEIADTARLKGERAVHPLVLVGGYLAVWLAAAVPFAAAGLALSAVLGKADLVGVPLPVAAAVLLGAGLYQFSGLKEACLVKCRNPFSVLFARWSARPSGVFRLGAEQGLWCLGCCWALMLVMFAVGLANLFWMALLAVFAVVEKQLPNGVTSRLAGAILCAWAAALLALSLGR